jgi:uracil-DNA glycosylase family 4
MTKKCLFDDIIECMNTLQEKNKKASVKPEILNEFMSQRSIAPAQSGMSSDVHHRAAPPLQQVDVANVNLEELRAITANCHLCRLHKQRSSVVFGEGDPHAVLMFIGEGPGQEEDRQGRPFVGDAGQLLDKMIVSMQFSRAEVFIANVVKCRPPGNRVPDPEEANQCLPYLEQQIRLINPKVIVLLGAVALRYIMKKEGISRERGNWQDYYGIKVMPTYHPAYLLRNPSAKKDVWSDLQQVMQIFGKVHSKS